MPSSSPPARHRLPRRRAEVRQLAQALLAVPARRQPREQDARAGGEADAVADRLDDAGALVAQDGRAARRGRPVDRIEIGVADARGAQAHEHFTGPGRGQLQLHELERRPGVLEDRRAYPQGAPPPGGPAPASASARRGAIVPPLRRGGLLQLAQGVERMVAAPVVAGLDLAQRRLLVHADVADEPRAARVEHAPGRRGGVGGDLAVQADPLAASRPRPAGPRTAAPRCTGAAVR